MKWPLTACLGALALASPALAQRDAACPPAVPVPDWNAIDLGLATPGSSAPDGDGAFTLCSDGAGHGASDALRTLTQNVDHDFTLDALLVDVEAGGLGGLEARTAGRLPEGPRMHLSVVREGDGAARLLAGVRTGDEVAAAPELPVELPVHLRLRREGGLLTAAWSPDGQTFFDHLTFDSAATALAETTLAVAAAQAAPGAAGARTASFARVRLADFTPPPDAACTQADVSPGGALVTITGSQLRQVVGARVAGERAAIVAQDDGRLVLRAPRPEAAVASGAVVLESAEGETAVGGHVAYAGRPFIRGDVNDDGRVDDEDARQLVELVSRRRPAVRCEAAADTDADGDIDGVDHAHLVRALQGRRVALPAPYPAPGFARAPTLACGLGAPPIARALYDRTGRPLAAGAVLREGDVVELRGEGLPTGHHVSFYFGDVRLEQLPFGDPQTVLLRVGPVPTAGTKCPRLFESGDADATPAVRFGLLRDVRPDTRARHLCPTFEASRGVVGGVRWDAGRGELRVRVPRDGVDPRMGVQVDLLLARPAMTGGDRGSREISVRARASDPRRGYESMLEALAVQVSRALDGGTPAGDCGDCDFAATPDLGAGELVIRPCAGGLPPEPPPPPPPHETTLAPYVPALAGGSGQVQAIQPSCEDDDVASNPRLNAWCVYERSTRTSVIGLPSWESSIPRSVLYDGPNAPAGLPHPADRALGDKSILFSTEAWTDAMAGGYLSACAQAARVAYCNDGSSDWMPPFTPSARIYKAFWRPLGKLPMSADPDALYSYQPPSGPRQYLVGLHISSGTGDIITYWKWATFWYPRGNDTLTKDGQPLATTYNPACTSGNQADLPEEVQGVWRNYHMCVDGVGNGGAPCGNPWGPTDECKDTGCRECHIQTAIALPEDTINGELSTAWMGSLTRATAVKECLATIKAGLAQNQKPYFNLAPPECVD